jgi:hypothetical protein
MIAGDTPHGEAKAQKNEWEAEVDTRIATLRAKRKGRCVMDHHNIERIAVIGCGRGNESPIVRIGQPGQ